MKKLEAAWDGMFWNCLRHVPRPISNMGTAPTCRQCGRPCPEKPNPLFVKSVN